jgi:hypothetical protein
VVAAVAVVAWRWAPVPSVGADAGSDQPGEALADVSAGLLTPTAGIVAAGLVLIGGVTVVVVDAVRARRFRAGRPAAVAPHHRALDLPADAAVDVHAPAPVPAPTPVGSPVPVVAAHAATASDLSFRTRLAAGLHDELFTHRDAPAPGS